MSQKRKHIFISHHHRDDAAVDKLTDLLRRRDLDIRNSSIRLKPANQARWDNQRVSDEVIKRLLRRRISWASKVVVLIGEQTHSRRWVDWEIEEAHRQGKEIIGVFERGGLDAEVPDNLEKYGCARVGWNADRIIAAIEGTERRFENSAGQLLPGGSRATSRC